MTPGRPKPGAHVAAHGGDLDLARARFPDAPLPWIDLSTGINPARYPLPDLPPEVWARLPLRSDELRLKEVAARRYGAASADAVVSAPGTQSIIQVLPRLVPPSRVAVLGPTYGEHAAAWRQAGHDVVEVGDLDAARAGDVVVVVNPDNPTGRIVPRDTLREVAARLHAAGGLLVVDEAFADAAPDGVSVVPDLMPSTVVLRSLGKMYGLAGVRLGFAIAQDALARRIEEALGPWAVSGPALVVGAAALADDAWLNASRAELDLASKRLDGLLAHSGCTVLGGTWLFRLVTHPEAARVADVLGREGILVREFSYAPTWLRFGLPGSESEWGRLEQALGAVCRADRVRAPS